MIPSRKPLFELTARDLMTPTVLALPEKMRLPAAARLLRHEHVSGAPVIDAEGRCVGVLSTTDIMHWAEARFAGGGSATADSFLSGVEWEVVEPEELPHDEVRDHMTANPVTVTQEAPIVRMAQMMLDGHIHRLIVLDDGDRPIGIVSATDILAAVARGDVATPNNTARPTGPAEEVCHERHDA
jgi:CBS domain-containing protein